MGLGRGSLVGHWGDRDFAAVANKGSASLDWVYLNETYL